MCYKSTFFGKCAKNQNKVGNAVINFRGCIWIVSGLTALKNLISINLFHILCRNKKRFILECNILDEKVCNEVEFTFDNQ